MMLSTARNNAHLAVDAPSFDMCPLLFMDEETLFAGTTPKKDASLSELSNLFMSPIYYERRDAR